MPHEVIMPALGMAQDTGLIVAWLKSPGDKVAAGEPLMEVETDKSTMEVEAASDGFLTDVRVAAGESAPVGEVIAFISESADGAGGAAKPKPKSAEPAATAPESEDAAEAAPGGRKVIMPALGMAQDAGKIVAWAKRPGDAVAEGDVLFEVETDKATMEVEADAAGWLAAVYAGDGDEVPVGQVIAVISAEKPETPVVRKGPPGGPAKPPPSAGAEAPAPPPPETASRAALTGRAAHPAPAASATLPSDGRVLASPKARRLAAERGLDLRRLFEAGGGAPLHVGDLDRLAASAAAAPSAGPGAAAAPAEADRRAEARIPAAPLAALREALGPDAPAPTDLLAAFAAAALRAATGAGSLLVRVERPGAAAPAHRLDPDVGGGEVEDGEPALILRDLVGSRITALRLGAPAAPVLTVAREGDDFAVSLDFRDAQLKPDAAFALLAGFAERLDEPLRQLL